MLFIIADDSLGCSGAVADTVKETYVCGLCELVTYSTDTGKTGAALSPFWRYLLKS